MDIGSIVKSNSHVSYLCRVYGKLETAQVPEPHAYAFGTFVTLAPVSGSPVRLIGIIRDTLLINPEYGAQGPRLSPDQDLAVFSPDYLNERGVLVEVLVLGWVSGGQVSHTTPAVAAQIGARVMGMDELDVLAFHRDSRGRFLIGYLPSLISRPDPLVANLLLAVLERLAPAFPEQQRVIDVLKNNLAWKARVVPAG
ncbi:MAG: hypothetical protein PVSMB7_28770 [Chloroflexota bacterium]